jgi:TetR/AcrR family transcriptional repressor of nem operon
MVRPKTFDEDRALDCAVDCFWARGYPATSVRDLGEAMGIGGGSLYNAYGGKQALFARALERYADRSMRERVARLEACHPPQRAIAAFLDEIIERSVSDPEGRGCLLVNTALDAAPHDAEIGASVGGYLAEIRGFFRRCLAAAQRSGALSRRLDVEVVSAHLLGVVLGLRVLARLRGEAPAARRRLLQAVARPALELIEASPARPPTTPARSRRRPTRRSSR